MWIILCTFFTCTKSYTLIDSKKSKTDDEGCFDTVLVTTKKIFMFIESSYYTWIDRAWSQYWIEALLNFFYQQHNCVRLSAAFLFSGGPKAHVAINCWEWRFFLKNLWSSMVTSYVCSWPCMVTTTTSAKPATSMFALIFRDFCEVQMSRLLRWVWEGSCGLQKKSPWLFAIEQIRR
jgi:hypothetical protein